MPHTTEIVEVVELSDGQHAIRVRCCGDDSTLSSLTVDSKLLAHPETLNREILSHRKRVSDLHDSHLKCAEHLQGLVGQKVEH